MIKNIILVVATLALTACDKPAAKQATTSPTEEGAASPSSASRVDITLANFSAEVEKSKKPVLVDFWAPWCGPCRAIDPHLKAISETNKDVKIAKLNVDDNKELSEKFGITGIPCMIIFKNGVEVDRLIGGVPKEKIEEFIAKNK